MAVAAYSSVLSLLRMLDNVQHHSYLRFFRDTSHINALQEKLCILQHFLEQLHSSMITEDMECMVRKIPQVTYDAEILIDNYVADRLYKELYPQSDVLRRPIHKKLHRVIQEIASINEALATPRTIQRGQEKPVRVLDKFSGDKPLKNKVVGFEDQLNQVLEKLTGDQPYLVIVPIVGMGGIGKTTLARSLFDHSYNLHRFDVRIWLTISQDYSVKKVLQGLLNDGVLGDKKDKELGHESESELITQLHQKLFGKRYLIVLDDVWSLDAWYDLKQGFPNYKGSRVMVTTRLSKIVDSLDSSKDGYSMKFLDEDKSWDLFSERAFEKGGRSVELEVIGREISKRCKGLPILLASIGGLLANSNMTVEHWQTVAEDINSFDNSANDEYCSRILSLSYHELPIHLKPCFLYMRHFKEDSNIKVSELIEKWVAQGFVKSMRGKTLEEAAKIYVEDLVGRNMFLVRKRGRNGDIKICGIHDLLRDLSVKESNKERFLELPKVLSAYDDTENAWVVCNEQEMKMTTFNSEILGSAYDGKFPKFVRSRFVRAAKVLPQYVLLPTTCRSIVINVGVTSVSRRIRLIWNLEILDIKRAGVVLPELWEMPQLRHVRVPYINLPEPVSTENDVIVLENLQTLEEIGDFVFTEEIVRRIPNIRKLGLSYNVNDGEEGWHHLQNLAHLQKLESLYINYCSNMDLTKVIAFPCSLKELTLENCKIAWDDLTIIGLLPNLQVLKLLILSVSGEEWNPIEGEFLRLKYLKLSSLYLVEWRVDGTTHFPALEALSLNRMNHLEEIPLEIGELPSLKSIYLELCKERIVDSARVILEEQLSNGNQGLVVHVKPRYGQNYQIGGANYA